jgi:hypothetical protein
MIYRWSAPFFIVPALAGMIAGVVWICTGFAEFTDPADERARGSLSLVGTGLIAIAVCAILLWNYLSATYEITPG